MSALFIVLYCLSHLFDARYTTVQYGVGFMPTSSSQNLIRNICKASQKLLSRGPFAVRCLLVGVVGGWSGEESRGERE